MDGHWGSKVHTIFSKSQTFTFQIEFERHLFYVLDFEFEMLYFLTVCWSFKTDTINLGIWRLIFHNTNISVMILKFVFFGFFEIFLLLFLHFQYSCGLWINLFLGWFYYMLPSLIKNCIHQSRIINLWLLWWDVLCRVWSFISQSFYFLHDIIFFNQAGWWDNFSGKLKLLCWKS